MPLQLQYALLACFILYFASVLDRTRNELLIMHVCGMVFSMVDNIKQFRWDAFILVAVSRIYIYFKTQNKKCCTSYVSVKRESCYYTVKIQALQVRFAFQMFLSHGE